MSLIAFTRKTTPPKSADADSADSAAAPGDHQAITRDDVAKYRITTTIPAGACVQGNLVLDESVILGGEVGGSVTIRGAGMACFVKRGGVVQNGIKASIVLIYGEVYGHIEASFVRIFPGGRFEGILHAEALHVDRGGILLNDTTLIAPPGEPGAAAAADIRSMSRPASADERQKLKSILASAGIR